jgi:hypothetical protein
VRLRGRRKGLTVSDGEPRRSGRVGPDQQPCVGVWPITGKPCMHAAEDGYDTCLAHDPAGDRRWPPPPDEKRCTAKTKESGERCRKGHGPGGKVCEVHGGRTPNARSGTEKRVADQKVRALVATYGLPVEITPEKAILDEIHRTAGHVAWLEERIRELDADQLIWGVTKEKDGGEDRGTTFEAVPHAFLKLYQQERSHLAKVCSDAIRAGLEARQVKLAEEQGAMVAQAVRAILNDLKLTAEQRALVSTIVPQHLRELALMN